MSIFSKRLAAGLIGLAAVAAVGFAALGLAAPAAAQDKMVLKAADVHPLGYPTVEAVVRMGKKLEEATDGRISIEMFHTMQLGGEKEMIEQAQIGALQIARISVGPVGTIVEGDIEGPHFIVERLCDKWVLLPANEEIEAKLRENVSRASCCSSPTAARCATAADGSPLRTSPV
mgnify:CR=1 FL=1